MGVEAVCVRVCRGESLERCRGLYRCVWGRDELQRRETLGPSGESGCLVRCWDSENLCVWKVLGLQ